MGGELATVLAMGFLLGSVPFSYLLIRRRGVDLRVVGSGNVGASNALRVSSPGTAVTVLALDATKGGLAVWLAEALTRQHPLAVCAGLAAVVGHIYPPWLGFRGGKGVATSAGVFAVLAPAATAIAALLFVAILAFTRYVSLGSLAALIVLPPLAAWLGGSRPVVAAACAAAALVGLRHRGNLRRLWAGTEHRLGQPL